MYCPRCKRRLYPADAEYMKVVGVCSYCVQYGNSPENKKYREKFDKHQKHIKGKIDDSQ